MSKKLILPISIILIALGIKSEKPDLPVKVITNEVEALNFALKKAKKNDLLVLLPDNIPRAIMIVNEFRDKLNQIKIEQSDIPNMNEET